MAATALHLESLCGGASLCSCHCEIWCECSVALHLFVDAGMSGDHADISSCHWLERLLPVIACHQKAEDLGHKCLKIVDKQYDPRSMLGTMAESSTSGCQQATLHVMAGPYVPWKMLTGEVLLVRGERRSEEEAHDTFIEYFLNNHYILRCDVRNNLWCEMLSVVGITVQAFE